MNSLKQLSWRTKAEAEGALREAGDNAAGRAC